MNLGWNRLARGLALVVGLVFGVGAVWKIVEWPGTVEAMGAYSILSALPAPLLAGACILLELFVAFCLLHERLWHRWGLPAAAGFLAFTAVVLALQTATGGGGDCGCLPFLPRRIGWLSAGQNLFAAAFLAGMWGLSRGEGPASSAERATPSQDS